MKDAGILQPSCRTENASQSYNHNRVGAGVPSSSCSYMHYKFSEEEQLSYYLFNHCYLQLLDPQDRLIESKIFLLNNE